MRVMSRSLWSVMYVSRLWLTAGAVSAMMKCLYRVSAIDAMKNVDTSVSDSVFE